MNLKINSLIFGKVHPNYATSLNNLAVLYQALNSYSKAEPLFQEALKIREKAGYQMSKEISIPLDLPDIRVVSTKTKP